MTGMRQGVTPTQHAVLDLIEQQAPEWSDLWDFEAMLIKGKNKALCATRVNSLIRKRKFAIEAAAMLIDAADEIGRMLALDGDL